MVRLLPADDEGRGEERDSYQDCSDLHHTRVTLR